jgi:hypothetical protein
MEWWRWVVASVEALLLLTLILLWYDGLREKRDWRPVWAVRATGVGLVIVPLGFLVVLLVPLWLGLILVAIPAVTVVSMALAS